MQDGSDRCRQGPVPGVHCLLSGPSRSRPPTPSEVESQLSASLPTGVSYSDGELLAVKQGTVVLQATPTSFANWPAFGTSPFAGYYVLHDDVALLGSDITNPEESTDSTGLPDVAFGFTSDGGNEFQKVTSQIAARGQLNSLGSSDLVQHFAVALDNRLVTVPSIDFHTYPDGITGGGGADITGGFTIDTAEQLANELRLGALPINLRLISTQSVSATLGQQALNQGLVAGAVGLLIVALFLLIFYRVLGLIAIAGLAIYGIYFYALIKLIPITMTLAGIAGLILTIGVAADANIVIFERVKEEIRAGRSIRQGIATGYRKGLTAIIDANVVTIMTAFILFVLATADVKGFAFTLGIGVFVSLFTAVLATQAILMTMGDSRVIASPAGLGAAGGSGAGPSTSWASPLLLLDVRRDPAHRRARDRRQGDQPRDRLHLGDADHGRARASRERHAGPRRSSRPTVGATRRSSRSAATRALGDNGFQIADKFLGEHQANSIEQTLQSVTGSTTGDHSLNSDLGRPDVRQRGRQQRGDRDHRVADRDLALRRAAVRLEVRAAGADRPDARPADHQWRVRADREGW